MGKKNLIWVIIFTALVFACLAYLIFSSKNSSSFSADIYVGNSLEKHIDSISDSKLHSYTLKTQYGYNKICWQNGEIWVEEADCKNQTCVNFGKLKSEGTSIICAPHKVVITLTKGGNS